LKYDKETMGGHKELHCYKMLKDFQYYTKMTLN